MNIDKIKKLGNDFIIAIDIEKNSLLSNVPILKNGRIFVSKPGNGHRFDFKIIWHKKGIAQIQCLSSYKLMTINQKNEVYFEEYFKLNDLSVSLFYVVYDEISLCVFPFRFPNFLLTYNEGLYFRSTDHNNISPEEQTIFEYDQIQYDDLQIITNQNNLVYDGIEIIHVTSIKEAIHSIVINYYNLREKILLCFGKLMFPMDFYLDQENWCFVDRKFSFPKMRTYKRDIELGNLTDLEFLPTDDREWMEIKSIADEIPKLVDTQMIWDKLISNNISGDIYYSSLGTYIVTSEQIRKKNVNYYNKIYNLLDKTKEPRIYKLIEYALMTIFFSD